MKSALIILIGSIGFTVLQSATQGLPTGKRQHNPVVTKSMDTTKPKATGNSIKSPRDLSSGQATGKRQHLPVSSAVNTNGNNAATQPGVNKIRNDSLLWIKNNPGKPFVRTGQKETVQTGQVNKTKLDDLKNPFDTTKKVKPVQQQPAGQNK